MNYIALSKLHLEQQFKKANISSLHLKLLHNILATQIARVAVAAAFVTRGTYIYLRTFRIPTCTFSGKTKINRAGRTFGNAVTQSTTTVTHVTALSIETRRTVALGHRTADAWVEVTQIAVTTVWHMKTRAFRTIANPWNVETGRSSEIQKNLCYVW